MRKSPIFFPPHLTLFLHIYNSITHTVYNWFVAASLAALVTEVVSSSSAEEEEEEAA